MNKQFSTILSLLLTVFFWGLSFIGIKFVLKSFSPFVYMFLRFFIASLFFLCILLYKGFPSLERKTHLLLFLTALFEPGLYFIFETYGLTLTTASNASIITAMVPVLVMILASLLLKETISKRSVFGIFGSFLGIIVLVLGKSGFSWTWNTSTWGDLLMFGAAVSAAMYMVLARSLSSTLSSLEITSFQMFYGTIFFLPAFLMKLPSLQWSAVTLDSIIALLFLALFASVAGYFLYNYALTQIPASRASVFLNGIPVVTTIAAAIILGEHLTPLQTLGAIIAITSVTIANWPQSAS
ncbi:MAG TPA: DMT family transporter [Syntrophomonadaceae bacterium]|nr:DMT family transporter [Syntrophomonadaceae bacterium]